MARSQGSAALLALTTFLGLFFIAALILAIVFYVQIAGFQQDAETAIAERRELATEAELGQPAVQALRDGQGTVVGELLEQNEELKAMLNADRQITVEALQGIINGLDVSGSMVGAVRALKEEVAFAQEQQQAAEAARDAADKRAQDAEASREAIRSEFDRSVADAQTQARQQQTAAETVRNDLSGVQSDLGQQLDTFRQQQSNELQDRDTTIVELRRRIRELEAELTTNKLIGVYARAITDPDGMIVSIPIDDDKVYINVGSSDGVVPGMAFEVFRPGDLIGLEEFDEIRGIGTLEVITTEGRTSMTRVVRLEPGQDVSEGDVIVNLIFDPNADLKFHVFGEFDIDNTGQSSAADRRQIESMIERWGGETVEAFSPDVDFLVLGAEPELPDPLPPGTTDPVLIQEQVRAQRAYETWQDLAAQAADFQVPVLNKNRFLGLIGYYER
ncbi:MAG: hypothetical protein AAFY08_05180 [Planctomycetota bacterium]